MECVIPLLSRTIKSRSGRSPGHVAGPRNVAWQCCCSVAGYQINTQFDFSISQYIALHWPGERQGEAAANGHLHQKLPSHSWLEGPHLFPVNEFLPSVKLQLLTFVLFKSKLQGSYGRPSVPSRYQLSRRDAELKARAIAVAVVLSRTVCLGFDKEHTQRNPGLAWTIRAERGTASGTCWRAGAHQPVMSEWRFFLHNDSLGVWPIDCQESQ